MPPPLRRHAVSGVCLEANQRELTPAGLAAENNLPGDSSWMNLPSRPADLALYLSRPSAECGDTISVHLRGRHQSAVVKVYRFGWYHGALARVVWQSSTVTAPEARMGQPVGPSRALTMTWPEVATISVRPDWVPGLYAVTVGEPAGPAQSLAPLVIRADDVATPLTYVTSDTTWAAYNDYGGCNQYRGGSGSSADRCYEVGYHRPLAGTGLRQFLTMDRPLVSFMEQHGFVASMTSITALDNDPSGLLQHAGIVIGGHNEYWTSRAYRGLIAARNRGVNVAILGANELYWHIRVTTDAVGTPVGQSLDTVAVRHPSSGSAPRAPTLRWVNAPLHRENTGLSGARFAGVSVFGPERVMRGDVWPLTGTGLSTGSLVVALAGNEVDSVVPRRAGTAPLAGAPPNLTVLLEGVFAGRPPHRHPGTVTVSYYSDTSGAGVFAAGTTYWACEVANICPLQTVPAATRTFVTIVTLNVLDAFSRPHAGGAHPSQDSRAWLASELMPVLGLTNIGSRYPDDQPIR